MDWFRYFRGEPVEMRHRLLKSLRAHTLPSDVHQPDTQGAL